MLRPARYEIDLHDSNVSPLWFFQIYVSGTSYAVAGRTNIADGNWHHVVGIRSGNTIQTYEDGTFANTHAGSSGSVAKNSWLIISGARGNGDSGNEFL